VPWVIAAVHCHDVPRLGTFGEALLADHASIGVGDGERPQLTSLLSRGVAKGTEGERERLGDKSEDTHDDGQEAHCDDDGDSGKGHHRGDHQSGRGVLPTGGHERLRAEAPRTVRTPIDASAMTATVTSAMSQKAALMTLTRRWMMGCADAGAPWWTVRCAALRRRDVEV
jgi:hypothetical protein